MKCNNHHKEIGRINTTQKQTASRHLSESPTLVLTRLLFTLCFQIHGSGSNSFPSDIVVLSTIFKILYRLSKPYSSLSFKHSLTPNILFASLFQQTHSQHHRSPFHRVINRLAQRIKTLQKNSVPDYDLHPKNQHPLPTSISSSSSISYS